MASPALQLDTMKFFGRLASDYREMFDVSPEQLRGQRILDCPGGPCSFVAEACAAGAHAVAVDPLYAHTADELHARCEADIEGTIKAMSAYPGAFADLDLAQYAETKRTALRGFLADYPAGRAAGRYVAASLPALPFADRAFDRTFSAHLLFTYSDPASGGILLDSPFTEAWHVQAVQELLRVTERSLHLYPTTTRTEPAHRHPYLERIVASLEAGSTWSCRCVPSTYERGNAAQNQLNSSLVIERRA